VVQIGAGKVARRRAAALCIERPRIGGVVGVLDIDRAETRKCQSMAAVARRHDAIEHVDAAGDRFEQIGGCADTHQIARLVGRQHRGGLANDFEHDVLRLADGEAAERIAVEADVGECARARLA